ncbi:unnamed protein product [Malus baccata var. baccata]
MALRNTAALIFFVMMVLSGVCLGDVYRVGDSDGWTSRGLVDYNKWASTKEFHVGDTLIFAYNSQYHNLMQVTKQDFESCNTTAAITVYTSGSDTITLRRPDHYYFLCGAPGLCQAGQKVDIKVTLPIPQSSLASPNPAPQGSLPSDSHPSSNPSSAPTIYFSKLGDWVQSRRDAPSSFAVSNPFGALWKKLWAACAPPKVKIGLSKLGFKEIGVELSGLELCSDTHWEEALSSAFAIEVQFPKQDSGGFDRRDYSDQDYNLKIDRIISAGEIEETSRVMVSIGSEGFVDRLVEASPCSLLPIVHDSLFVLAGIKEKYDKVKCWQGELIYVPDKWAPLDVVFLYCLPAVPLKLDKVFKTLARCFTQGARLVISHPQGREVLEQQRRQYPDVVTSDLPEKSTLEEAATEHSFELTEYVDEPCFYLAVLKFVGARN